MVYTPDSVFVLQDDTYPLSQGFISVRHHRTLGFQEKSIQSSKKERSFFAKSNDHLVRHFWNNAMTINDFDEFHTPLNLTDLWWHVRSSCPFLKERSDKFFYDLEQAERQREFVLLESKNGDNDTTAAHV